MLGRGRIRPALACAAIGVVAAGCMPAPATEQAQAVATLWSQFLVAAALVGGTVWALITFMIVRYRRRPSETEARPARSDWLQLELAWTAIPIVIVLVLFGLTLVALGRVDARAASQVTIDVTAYRWQWRFDYEGTPVSVSGGPDQRAEMVVPAGEPIHIVLTSVDVDHAFYVPAFLFKRDAIPGHPNEFDLTITDPGSYAGQCAEFCGIYHDRMLLVVRAVTRPEFDAWIASHGTPSPAINPPSSAP
jgi:cytochrome c oxidase subunit 2